jgi:hypothetical protein
MPSVWRFFGSRAEAGGLGHEAARSPSSRSAAQQMAMAGWVEMKPVRCSPGPAPPGKTGLTVEQPGGDLGQSDLPAGRVELIDGHRAEGAGELDHRALAVMSVRQAAGKRMFILQTYRSTLRATMVFSISLVPS